MEAEDGSSLSLNKEVADLIDKILLNKNGDRFIVQVAELSSHKAGYIFSLSCKSTTTGKEFFYFKVGIKNQTDVDTAIAKWGFEFAK